MFFHGCFVNFKVESAKEIEITDETAADALDAYRSMGAHKEGARFDPKDVVLNMLLTVGPCLARSSGLQFRYPGQQGKCVLLQADRETF